MINRLFLYESPGYDPHRNLAMEELLLNRVQDCAILYLWQNQNTVVIGKNQNPWKECKTALLNQEGGILARRLSGGGAVFHDLGNLNFTILLPREDYDLDRQFGVIAGAVESLGIPVERSGRNDLLAGGQKFSGNAFYKAGDRAYHHGTLMVEADLQKLGRYLSPSKLKLQAKGVDSVRSRVENLSHWKPGLRVEDLKQAMQQAFSQVYDLPLEPMAPLEEEDVQTLTARNAGWDWNYGRKIPFTATLEARLSFGGIELGLTVEGGIIQSAVVYTDAMDDSWKKPLENALTGCRFQKEALREKVFPLNGELCELFEDM